MIPDLRTKKIFFLRLGIVLIFILFLSGIGLAQYVTSQEKKIGDRIYPNVYIDELSVGGKSKTDVLKQVSDQQKKLAKVKFTVLYKDEPIATFSGQKLGLKTDIKDVVDRAYLVGRVEYLPSRAYQKFASFFNFDKFVFKTNVVYQKDVIKEFVSRTEDAYNKPAKDALFKFEEGRVTAFKPEEKGVKIESEKFLQDINKSIADEKTKVENKTIKLTEKVSDPEITLAEANEFGIEGLIGEGQSNYSGSHAERIHNLLLAASRINGVMVPKGEEFSFNRSVGEISSLTGYTQAYVIKNGKTVLDDGGGVCQVSSTLFRAALNSGLPISARTAHAYRVAYYENDSQPGFDATTFSPYVDFRFINDTPAAILIETDVDEANNLLRFKFYGKNDGRKVYVSQARVWDVVGALPDVHQDDPTLKKGVVKQVDFAAGGAKAAFDYKVTKSNGEVSYAKTFTSIYRPWAAVFLVGTGEF